MKVIVLFGRLYEFSNERYRIGGVATYIRRLHSVVAALGAEYHAVFFDATRNDVVLQDGLHAHSIEFSKNESDALIKRACEIGDYENDVLVFGTSTIARKTPFRHTVGIQHGIYWDLETMHGTRIVNRTLALALRAAQARQQLRCHEAVSEMVCVDLNYVNWMRSLCVANRLPYTYIPNFAAVPDVTHTKDVHSIRIVFARRFEWIRGCGLLMQFMPRVLEEHPEVELTIAGAGTMEDDLRRAFGSIPRVDFTRYDAVDSIDFHSHYHIALVPSIGSEGTSLSLLEAMSAECAVVATDIGGMSNIVLDGHNGMLVRPDADDLYGAVTALVTGKELRSRLAANARQTVIDSFTLERWEERWTRVLGAML